MKSPQATHPYLPSCVRGSFFYLYLIVDVWSRRIVAAQVHQEETMELASELIDKTCTEEKVDPRGLVLHSDNGGPMKGSTMLTMLYSLGIVPSFSRPSVSDDNPFSEALFRTLKYRPEYPRKPFRSIEEASRWVARFVRWYNAEHLHSGIRFITPEARHFGQEQAILQRRDRIYQQARRKNPSRWTAHTRNWQPIEKAVLNPERASHQCVASK